MTALTDRRILSYIKKKKLIISPFDDDTLTPNGYDLELEDWEIPAGKSKIIMSKAKIELSADMIAIPLLRSTYIYKGLILSPGIPLFM